MKKAARRIFRNDRDDIAKLEPKYREIASAIRGKKLTYLSGNKLVSIVETCEDIEANNLDGYFLEAGCALGGSAILITKLKNQSRQFNVYDVFEIIPAPTDEDGEDVQKRYEKISSGKSRGIGGDKYYGYEDNLVVKVRNNLAEFGIAEDKDNVALIKGLLQDTMKLDGPVAFAHIDVDWYDPVKTCLERIIPRLIVGGSIILDDYQDWSGCQKATDEYFLDKKGFFKMDNSAGSMKITRIKE